MIEERKTQGEKWMRAKHIIFALLPTTNKTTEKQAFIAYT